MIRPVHDSEGGHVSSEFTYSFLDTDTITVRNKKGVAVTFSILGDMAMEKYDRLLEFIKQKGWTNLKLITHTPVTPEEMASIPRNQSDGGTDGKLIDRDLKLLGVTHDEYDRMYRFAQVCLVESIRQRLSRT